jgi:hypothetical protein
VLYGRGQGGHGRGRKGRLVVGGEEDGGRGARGETELIVLVSS